MAYVKTTWVNKKTKLNASNMNNIEAGIIESKDAAIDASELAEDAIELANTKEDKIDDLETIRTGAARGSTAVQPSALNDYRKASAQDVIDDRQDTDIANKQNIISDLTTIRNGAALGATALQEHQSLAEYRKSAAQDIIDLGKQPIISDLSDIRRGAELGMTALQEHQSLSEYRKAEMQDFIDDTIRTQVNQKQDKLTAGNNIILNGSNISAIDTVYSAGDGIQLNNTEISVNSDIARKTDLAPKADLPDKLPPELKAEDVEYPWFMINMEPKGIDASGNLHLVHSGYNFNAKQYYTWPEKVIPMAATESTGGVMTAADKTKLNAAITEHQDISGKADKAALAVHTENTNIHVTADQKSTWNSKQDNISDLTTIRSGATLGSTSIQPNDNISKLINDAGYLTQHQDISGKANVGDSYTKAESDAKYLTEHQDISGKANQSDLVSHTSNSVIHVTSAEKLVWDSKQDKIEDLATIKAGAALGATSIQSHQDISGKADKTYVDTEIAKKQDVIDDLDVIRDGANLGASALQEHQSLAAYRTSSEQDTIDDGLKDRISNLEARGRFLSAWKSTEGKPETDPTDLPYKYKSGDYYIVSEVGATNYKPNGDQYTGVASTTKETNTVDVNDFYTYDGTSWILLNNTQKALTFSQITGTVRDNVPLKTELETLESSIATKQDKLTAKIGVNLDSSNNLSTIVPTVALTRDHIIETDPYTFQLTDDQAAIVESKANSAVYVDCSSIRSAMGCWYYTKNEDRDIIKLSAWEVSDAAENLCHELVYTKSTKQAVWNTIDFATQDKLDQKQGKLIAGDGIKLAEDNTISLKEPAPFERCDLDILAHNWEESVYHNQWYERKGSVKVPADFSYDDITVEDMIDLAGIAESSRCLRLLTPADSPVAGKKSVNAMGDTAELAKAILSQDFGTQIKLFFAIPGMTTPTVVNTTIYKYQPSDNEKRVYKELRFTISDAASPLNGTQCRYIPLSTFDTDILSASFTSDIYNYCDIWRFDQLSEYINEIYLQAYAINGKYYPRLLDETTPNSIDSLSHSTSGQGGYDNICVESICLYGEDTGWNDPKSVTIIDVRKLGPSFTNVESSDVTGEVFAEFSKSIRGTLGNCACIAEIEYNNDTWTRYALTNFVDDHSSGIKDAVTLVPAGTRTEGESQVTAYTSMISYTTFVNTSTDAYHTDMLVLTLNNDLKERIKNIRIIISTPNANKSEEEYWKIWTDKTNNNKAIIYSNDKYIEDDSRANRFVGTTVVGQANYIDSSKSQEAISLGNGYTDPDSGDLVRSNAATIDWDGTAWFAGDAYVGSTSGTHKDEGSKKLATENYVDSKIGIPEITITADRRKKSGQYRLEDSEVELLCDSKYTTYLCHVDDEEEFGDPISAYFTKGVLQTTTNTNAIKYDIFLQTFAGVKWRSVGQAAVSIEDKLLSFTMLDIATMDDVDSKSTVSVSSIGTATDTVSYITIDGTEKKLAGNTYSAGTNITIENNVISANVGGDIMQDPDDQTGGKVTSSALADVDSTLTIQGDAADAKATGDAIAANSAQIANKYTKPESGIPASDIARGVIPVVSVSASGTATDEVQYITINGVEKKLAGSGSGSTLYKHTVTYKYINSSTESNLSYALIFISSTGTAFTTSTISQHYLEALYGRFSGDEDGYACGMSGMLATSGGELYIYGCYYEEAERVSEYREMGLHLDAATSFNDSVWPL